MSGREQVATAAREVANQAESSLATTRDHAEREATFAVIAAFRAFADLIEKGSSS